MKIKVIKIICENPVGAALTQNKVYEAKPAFNCDYYRIVDDNGKLDSFRTVRFRALEQPHRKVI